MLLSNGRHHIAISHSAHIYAVGSKPTRDLELTSFLRSFETSRIGGVGTLRWRASASALWKIAMPLIPVARPAEPDHTRNVVRFAMKDGAKTVTVLISAPALDDVDIVPPRDGRYLASFKQFRKNFERIASDKYDRGEVESDGTVLVCAMDLPF